MTAKRNFIQLMTIFVLCICCFSCDTDTPNTGKDDPTNDETTKVTNGNGSTNGFNVVGKHCFELKTDTENSKCSLTINADKNIEGAAEGKIKDGDYEAVYSSTITGVLKENNVLELVFTSKVDGEVLEPSEETWILAEDGKTLAMDDISFIRGACE